MIGCSCCGGYAAALKTRGSSSRSRWRLLTFRAGLIARHEEWFDHAAGLRAAGLDAYASSTSRGRISSSAP